MADFSVIWAAVTFKCRAKKCVVFVFGAAFKANRQIRRF